MGIFQHLLSEAASFCARIRHHNRTKLRRTISDKTARDIGLDPTTLALLRHRWPSEGVDHERVKELVSRPPHR